MPAFIKKKFSGEFWRLPDRGRTDAEDLVISGGIMFGNGCYKAKIHGFCRRNKSQHRCMSAHAAVIAVHERQVAVAVFPPVLISHMVARIMQDQVIGEIAIIVMCIRMVIVMREQPGQLNELFCKCVICQELQQQEYGRELFQQIKYREFWNNEYYSTYDLYHPGTRAVIGTRSWLALRHKLKGLEQAAVPLATCAMFLCFQPLLKLLNLSGHRE